MKNTSDLKKELERQKNGIKKAEKAYNKSKANDSLRNVVLENEDLCSIVASLSANEAAIVFNEILNSTKFLSVFSNAANTSPKLNAFRKSKAAKAERRKAKQTQETLSEQTVISESTDISGDTFSPESTETENVAPQSEQAELSEQNTQSDSFVHTSAEMPTDFSQKWDQATSPEQTDPPDYPGSSY